MCICLCLPSGHVHTYTDIFVNRVYRNKSSPRMQFKNLHSHGNAKMPYEALSRACQSNRWWFTPNRKVMLVYQKSKQKCYYWFCLTVNLVHRPLHIDACFVNNKYHGAQWRKWWHRRAKNSGFASYMSTQTLTVLKIFKTLRFHWPNTVFACGWTAVVLKLLKFVWIRS